MSVSLEQLRRLRGQAGLHTPIIATDDSQRANNDATPTTASDSIAALRRLLGIRARATQATVAQPLRVVDRDLPGEVIAPGLHLVKTTLAWPMPRAPIFVDAKTVSPIEPLNALCFDTETTGLAGGAGTRAFMVGVSEWVPEGLRIRQLLCTTLAAEQAMLRTFASWIQPNHVLVSYNGRCYDAPLLTTRYRLARMPNPLAALAHADLLFAVRRRYRGVWVNCRLCTVERELLSIVRDDDLPGSQAPAAWLQYLRGGGAVDLRRVLIHNQQDVVSLMRLLTTLAV